MYKILKYDPTLKPFEQDIALRMQRYEEKKKSILGEDGSLIDFANGHHYFGFHREENGDTVYREWAPGADELHFTGDFNYWDRLSHPMTRLDHGVFEIRLSGEEALQNGQKVKVIVTKNGQSFERIPAYANYVVQDPDTLIFSAEVHFPEPFFWTPFAADPKEPLLVYECHVGMSSEEEKVSTYREFTENVLPRIKEDGYNTVQLMAVMEHPYYGSFGYQVSGFFAASSRFGTPEDLKELIDRAHQLGIRVLIDLVHSHTVRNEAEGIGYFDGTDYQYCHSGGRGDHPAWGTRLFDYGKNEVLHFLLSNLKFWMEEYRFDGFRFDGVTSMLYLDHGLGRAFMGYPDYYSMNTELDAAVYLMLANELIHGINPDAVTVAEDMSGMPGMCLPVTEGGYGFDYRLQMGTPDLWIRYLKDRRDEDWSMWQLWYELTGHRPGEKSIGYAESHDQAIVGDCTIMFRLCGTVMYTAMRKEERNNVVIDRAVALHKIIRLLSLSLSPNGYLNFMGNEFGHPDWIDFPREGNNWSYGHAKRQWSLYDSGDLKFRYLGDFDRQILALAREDRLFTRYPRNLWVHEPDQVLIFERNGDIFACNLNPTQSFTGYFVPVFEEGTYEVVLNTDREDLGGYGRIDETVKYRASVVDVDRAGFLAYLPSRTMIVYRKAKEVE